MAGLITSTTGLAFGSKLQFQTPIGGAGLAIQTTPSWVLSAGGVAATLDIDFVNNLAWNSPQTTSITSLLSCTRASTGYYTNADGTLTSFASNTLRYGTNGLLVEEARTNICLRSQEFGNASWTQNQVSITSDTVNAPDGTATADKITSTATSNTARQDYQIGKSLSAAAYTATCYFKKAEAGFGIVNIYDGSDHRTWFNLTTGTVGTSDAGNTGSIAALANGWYRATVTRTAASTANGGISIEIAETDGAYNNVNGNGLYAWGAQLELGSFPTSYIPTTSSSATRAADVVTMAASSLPVSTTLGTMYAQLNCMSVAGGTTTGVVSTSEPNGRLIYVTSAKVFAYDGTTAVSASNLLSDNATSKIATTNSVAGSAAVHNGGTVGTASAQTFTIGATANIGSLTGNTNFLNGRLLRMAVWNSRVSNANLVTLTT